MGVRRFSNRSVVLVVIMEDSNDIADLDRHTGGCDGPAVHLGGIQISFS